MNVFVFVIWIVAIGGATAVITEYLKSRAKRDINDKEREETIAQLNALEERIRVIERIVTENRFDLKREIDKL